MLENVVPKVVLAAAIVAPFGFVELVWLHTAFLLGLFCVLLFTTIILSIVGMIRANQEFDQAMARLKQGRHAT